MKQKSEIHNDTIVEYVRSTSIREPDGLADLYAATREQTKHPMMATDPEQGQFLAFLVRAIGAKRVLEIGVFTGVGSLWMADAVGEGGTVVACDISEEFTSIGKPFWEKAGLASRIDLRLAPAQETLEAMIAGKDTEPFDFCYIDADKEAYDGYYEQVIQLMRPGGIVAFDNMLLHGRVADPECTDGPVPAIRALNAKLHTDQRVDVSFLPMADGLYLARKR